MSRIVVGPHNGKISVKKFLGPDPDGNDYQNLMATSLSKDQWSNYSIIYEGGVKYGER